MATSFRPAWTTVRTVSDELGHKSNNKLVSHTWLKFLSLSVSYYVYVYAYDMYRCL